jgi:hydroxymethylbilane synthase
MKTLNAGCSTPLAARAICGNAVVALSACVLSADGATRIESGATGADARDLGESVARDLLDQGASALMGA